MLTHFLRGPLRGLILFAGFTAAAGSLRAESLSNGAVPATMDGGNSTYTLDNYAINWGAVAVNFGNTTDNNTLTIRNGATAISTSSTRNFVSIGKASGSDNNAATVTGAGSVWTTTGATFNVGGQGNYNSLTISDGGKVSGTSGLIGGGALSNMADGSYNSATVTGAGSIWTNTSYQYVGGAGSYNSLTVSDGGTISSDRGVMGSGNAGIAEAGSHNTVLVTGTGTLWKNTGQTTIGNNGSSNTFTLTEGATASSSSLVLGQGNAYSTDIAISNQLTVEKATTKWTVTNGVTVGYHGNANAVLIKSGAEMSSSGVSLIGVGSEIYPTQGDGNTFTVNGAGSRWDHSGTLVVGDYGSGNKLILSGGGYASSMGTQIGRKDVVVQGVVTGADNEVLVTGAGSVWENAGPLVIGAAGNTGNALTVADSGLALLGADGVDALTVAAGNYVRLDGGYIALFGDQQSTVASLIAAGVFQIKDGADWVSASLSDFDISYFGEGADTSAFTGGQYGDLGGYTVMTAAVPEPSTYALILLTAGGLVALHRRRLRV